MNGNREGEGEYLSPVQLSPTHSQSQDYSLSESGPDGVFCRLMAQFLGSRLSPLTCRRSLYYYCHESVCSSLDLQAHWIIDIPTNLK